MLLKNFKSTSVSSTNKIKFCTTDIAYSLPHTIKNQEQSVVELARAEYINDKEEHLTHLTNR